MDTQMEEYVLQQQEAYKGRSNQTKIMHSEKTILFFGELIKHQKQRFLHNVCFTIYFD